MSKVNRILYKLGLIPLFLVMAFVSDHSNKAQAQENISVTLNPGECRDETISVTLGEAPIPKLDILFLIDVSLSMEDTINEIETNTEQIVQDVRVLIPDTAFGLATFIDYPDPDPDLDRDPLVYPWRYDLPLTQDTSFLKPKLGEINVLFGGQEIEESYLRALDEAAKIPDWREDSRRLLILFGDGLPHDPDPGFDEVLGTPDDLGLDEVLTKLNENNITILSVYADAYYGNDNLPFHEDIATITGGQVTPLQDTRDVVKVIQQLVENAVTTIDLVLRPTITGEGLVQGGLSFSDVAPEDSREFEIEICAPSDAVRGSSYSFDLLAEANGVLISQFPVAIQIPLLTPTPISPSVTHTPTPTVTPTLVVDQDLDGGFWARLFDLPDWVYLVTILLLLLLLFWWLKSRNKKAPRKVAPPPSRGPVTKSDKEIKPPTDPGLHHGRGRRKK